MNRILILASGVISICMTTGCALLPQKMQDMAEAGKSGCDPRYPILLPFTKQFDACKAKFPKLADEYKAKEDRAISGKCNVFKGDQCYERAPSTKDEQLRTGRFDDYRIREISR